MPQKNHAKLRDLIAGNEPVIAPVALNPLMAKLAERAGFKALYLGGGAMGYLTCLTEANLTLTEMAEAGLAIRTVSTLPLILDGACGWGDPMHFHRTIPMAEAAGFEAIEIEDQILPKRAHHHVGVEHLVPMDLMVDKVKEAVAVRRSRDFLIIARSNAANKADGLDEALRRGEAMLKAGADMLLMFCKTAEQMRAVGEKLGAPQMTMIRSGGKSNTGLTVPEMMKLGYRLFVDPSTPLFAMHRALVQSYEAIRTGEPDPVIGLDYRAEQDRLHDNIGLDLLLDVERRTVEK